MPGINRFFWFCLLIGLFQGMVFYGSDLLFFVGETFFLFTWTLLLVGGTALQLLGEQIRQWRSVLAVFTFTLLMGGMTLWVSYGTEPAGISGARVDSWILSLVPLATIGACFLSAWPATKGQRWRYEELSRKAWNSVLIVLFALILMGLYIALVMLWGRLMQIVGIEFFKRHFWREFFMCVSLPMVFSLGMYLGTRNEKTIGLIRNMLFGACRWGLPLIALISVLFILMLPFIGLAQVWATGYSMPILLGLCAVQLFLLNGVFQDGNQPSPYPKWLVRFIELSLLCPLILAVLAFYSTWLWVEQYGVSTQRFIGLGLALLGGLYGLAAVWAMVLRSAVWLSNLRVTNPAIALLTCVLLVLINTPLLAPTWLGVSYQERHVLDERTTSETFDSWSEGPD